MPPKKRKRLCHRKRKSTNVSHDSTQPSTSSLQVITSKQAFCILKLRNLPTDVKIFTQVEHASPPKRSVCRSNNDFDGDQVCYD